MPRVLILFAQVMHLRMTIVAGGDAIRCFGFKNLFGFQTSVCPALIRISGLQETAAAAAAKIIGTIGMHLDKVLFSNHCLDDISEIFGHRIAKGFPHQLAGILNSEFNLTFGIPR